MEHISAYKAYKNIKTNNIYQIEGFAHSSDNMEIMVIYHDLKVGTRFVRTEKEFKEKFTEHQGDNF